MANNPLLFSIPVKVETPVPPLATAKVPVTPVDKGNPVKLVANPEAGVPRTGAVKVGEVKVLFVIVSMPVKLTFKFKAVCVAVLIGFNKSVVLSTFPRPTIVFEIPETVPVKVGESIGAFNAKDVLLAFKSKAV
jgi:hypothetical protein